MPRERILEAAVTIIDTEGADALSLRTLARRLDSSTATLYRHFANRADLVDQVVDHVLGGAPDDVDRLHDLSWDEACRALAAGLFATLREHPNLAPLLVARVPTGSGALARRELALQLLLAAGFEPAVAVRSYATLARYVLGFAIQLGGDGTDGETLAVAYRDAEGGRLSATATVAPFVPVPLEEEFSFGLELLLAGLAGHRGAGPGDF